MLPQMQRLANKVVLDWKVPWFRLDLFLLPDDEMLINELSFPGHMVNDGRDTARFDRILANASRCSTPPEPDYECSGEAESTDGLTRLTASTPARAKWSHAPVKRQPRTAPGPAVGSPWHSPSTSSLAS